MNTPVPYRLYGRPNAGSWVIQVALEEAGAPYERIWVGQTADDVRRFRDVVPTGKVPGLVLPDGTALFESAAMLIYLATEYPHTELAPQRGGARHATFLQWMVYLSANVYEACLRTYYSQRYTAEGEAGAAAVRSQALVDFRDGLELIAARLSPYVLGKEYSIADAYLYMLTTWWPDDKHALFARMPLLDSHAGLVAARPSVVKVEADHASAQFSS